MKPYCFLCGSQLIYEKEISPDETPMEYNENGIVGVYSCSNHKNYNIIFHIIDLEYNNICNEDIYLSREIRYFFEDNLD